MQPNQQSIILDTFPPARRGAAFGVAAIATIVAPVLGPTLGGYITDQRPGAGSSSSTFRSASSRSSWSSALVEDPPWVQEAQEPRHRLHRPVAASRIGLGCLEIMMDRGEDADWFGSPFIRLMALLAFLGIIGAIVWLLIARKPIVHLDVFKDRNFATGCLMIAATGGILYASAVMIPQLAQQISELHRDLGGSDPVAGRPDGDHSDPDRRAAAEDHAGAQSDRRGLHHHGLRLALFEPSGPQYRFRHAGRRCACSRPRRWPSCSCRSAPSPI